MHHSFGLWAIPLSRLTKRLSEGQRKAFPGLCFPLSMGTKEPRQWLDQASLNGGKGSRVSLRQKLRMYRRVSGI